MRFSQRGLVGHWRFNEGTGSTAYDSSPEGNNGTIYGASWVRGKFGYALKFDGTDDYVDCGSDESLNITDAVTIEAWVKPRGSYSDLSFPTIVRKEGAYALRFHYIDGSLQGIVWIGGSIKVSNALENAWDTTKWTYFVFVYDGQYLRLYRDGVEAVDPRAQTGAVDVTTNNLGIGATGDGRYFFNGLIDEVRIYNRALSAEEIKIHYAFTKYIKPHFIIMRRKL